jgi:DNA-binding NarL/FixJ family response regulator
MKDENGGAVVAVVGGGSAMARQAVEAVLMAAGLDLDAPTAAGAVVLVDPTEEEWTLVDRLRAHCVLVTTDPLDADGVLAAVLRGADAVLEADAPSEMLTHAVRVVCAGGSELSPLLVRLVADALRVHVQADEPTLRLTKREREILCSIDAGETVKQTARTLGIAPKTVENLQSRLFRKLGVRNRAQAVALAHSLGLIPFADAASAAAPPDGPAPVRTPQPSV